MSKCPTCNKTVYFAEQVQALGKKFHKQCFKCKQCSKTLTPGNISNHGDDIYCHPCYGSLHALPGYRGVLGSTQLDSHKTGSSTQKSTFAKQGVLESRPYVTKGNTPCPKCGNSMHSGAFRGVYCSKCGEKVF